MIHRLGARVLCTFPPAHVRSRSLHWPSVVLAGCDIIACRCVAVNSNSTHRTIGRRESQQRRRQQKARTFVLRPLLATALFGNTHGYEHEHSTSSHIAFSRPDVDVFGNNNDDDNDVCGQTSLIECELARSPRSAPSGVADRVTVCRKCVPESAQQDSRTAGHIFILRRGTTTVLIYWHSLA